MLADVVKIGNSKGIRIPSVILKECQIADKVELEVHEGKLVIIPIAKARSGWDEKFKEMRKSNDDNLLIDDAIDLDSEDWEWK